MFTALLTMFILAAVPAVPGGWLVWNGQARGRRWLGILLLILAALILLSIPFVVPVSFESYETSRIAP